MRAAILLAAGSSRRFGRADKRFAMLGGRPLIAHALAAARAAARRVIVVSGPNHARLARLLPGVPIVRARDHRDGLSASLRRGARALRPIEREAVIVLADMPFARLPEGARLRPGHDLARPVWRGRPGHPVLVRAVALKAMKRHGDAGLGAMAAQPLPGTPANLIDVDDRAALAGSRRRMRRWGAMEHRHA